MKTVQYRAPIAQDRAAPAQARTLAIYIVVLVSIAAIATLPFVYQGALGERDAYRVATGIIDAARTDQHLASPLLYGRDKSFAYFAVFHFISNIFDSRPEWVIPISNYFNCFSSLFIIIPFFILVQRYWGTRIAFLANLFLIFLPVWRGTSLYGHPMVPATSMLMCGLVLLATQNHDKPRNARTIHYLLREILTVAIFALSLMLRLDIALMFLMIPALLLLERLPYRTSLYRSITYYVLAIAIFFIFRAQLPEIMVLGPAAAVESGGVLADLLTWHNPVRLVQYFNEGTRFFIKACHPLYLLLFGYACFLLGRQRQYRTLLFIVPTFAVNYIFWLPNPYPARHFIYLAPVLALGVAIATDHLYHLYREKWSSHQLAKLLIPAVITATIIISSVNIYRPVFSESISVKQDQLSTFLLSLPPQDQPILVVGDVIPAILNMQIASQDTILKLYKTDLKDKLNRPIELFIIKGENNTFLSFSYYHRSRMSEDTNRLLNNDKTFQNAHILADPYDDQAVASLAKLDKKSNILKITPLPVDKAS